MRESQAEFHFAGVLNRFLAPARRGHPVVFAFNGTPAVKDSIEALGVPHGEVAEIRIDGAASPLSHRLRGGEHVEVAPVYDPAVATPPVGATGDVHFVLDVHLGRLAGYLRLLGVDTWYSNHAHDDELLAIAMAGDRRLLTRDTGLLKRTRMRRGAFVYATDPLWQVREVIDRFGLAARLAPFTRCARCNATVEAINAQQAWSQVPARAAAQAKVFSRCTGCGHLYWNGSHPEKLKARFAGVGITI